MTENETLKYLDNLHSKIVRSPFAKNVTENEIMALVKSKKTLEEIQQYRSVGTISECQEAMERQKAKTPDIWGDGYSDGKPVYDMYDCPNCGKSYEIECGKYKHCPECGQAINLRELEDC